MTCLFNEITIDKLRAPSFFLSLAFSRLSTRENLGSRLKFFLPNFPKTRVIINSGEFIACGQLSSVLKKMSFVCGINATFHEPWINESFKNHCILEPMILSYFLELSAFFSILRRSLVICGMFFNLVVVYVMLRSRKIWKNSSSFLVFHLSLIHVILYFVLPILLESPSSTLSCTIQEFVKHMFLAAIFGTLTALARARYRNIAHPFESLAPRRLKTFFLLIIQIWLFALTTTTPIFFTVQSRTRAFCVKEENKTAKMCHTFRYCYWPGKGKEPKTIYFVLAFLLPFIVTLLIYTKAALSLWKWTKNGAIHSAVAKHKAKIIRLMVMAVCVFALGWGPNVIVDCFRAYSFFTNLPSSHSYTLREACEVAELLSSCLNPILYAFFSPDFRKLCRQFCCCSCWYYPSCIRHRRFCLGSVQPGH